MKKNGQSLQKGGELGLGTFLFVDETGASIDMARRYDRAVPVKKVEEQLPRNSQAAGDHRKAGSRGTQGKLCVGEVVTRDNFLLCLRECLGLEFRCGDIVFVDDLSAHRGREVEEVVSARGVELDYLPSYSTLRWCTLCL